MKVIKQLCYESVIDSIDTLMKENDKAQFIVISWEDGDGFFDLCDEDGGIDLKQRHYYNLKDKCFKLKNKLKAKKIFNVYNNMKSFSSKNKMYRMGYDIYISFGKYMIAFCPEFNTGYLAERNFLEMLFGCVRQNEPWNSKKFNYWERML